MWHERSSIFIVACRIISCIMRTFSWGMWDLVPWPPVLRGQSLSHWTTREVPCSFVYCGVGWVFGPAYLVFLHFLSCFWVGHAVRLAGSQFPNQGLNPHPWQWKWGVLTTSLPENSPEYFFCWVCSFSVEATPVGLVTFLFSNPW